MLKLKVIACDVLNREISYLSSRSSCYIDTVFLHQGLHNTPEKLKALIQDEINKANEGFPYNHFGLRPHYDYIIVGFGLCSTGTVGISSPNIPLVIPRGHDCITLLLGSKERYREYFDSHPGTFWYSQGWIEKAVQPGKDRYEGLYKEYLEKYGKENADYLMDVEQSWVKDYSSAVHIYWSCLSNNDYYKQYTKGCAEFLNWGYDEIEGCPDLLYRMLNGVFDTHEVLLVPPGKKVTASYNENVITFE
ncbi:MAG: DUF1638 domain-containing protein [Clostridia bacterium]|nr:DUF1638 domain-containing protein [Clostridia bacterium]